MDFWRDTDHALLGQASTYKDVFAAIQPVIRRIPHPVSLVSGPLTTGGLGSFEENLKVFNRAIELLRRRGRNVFDQRPLEEHFIRIRKQLGTVGYPEGILLEFYLPLFRSSLIDELWFIPGWHTSHGASWEHGQARDLGIEIRFFSFEELDLPCSMPGIGQRL